MNTTEIILAIDPGYDRVGVALISLSEGKGILIHSACIVTKKTDTQEKRLAYIYTRLETMLTTWIPTTIALETLFFSINKKTVMKVAESRGVIVLLAGLHNLPLIELSPQEVKLAMTGIGNANKTAVQKMVSLSLKIDTNGKLDDEIDAIALGFAAVGYIKQKKWK